MTVLSLGEKLVDKNEAPIIFRWCNKGALLDACVCWKKKGRGFYLFLLVISQKYIKIIWFLCLTHQLIFFRQ
jgi:hypothetical protein